VSALKSQYPVVVRWATPRAWAEKMGHREIVEMLWELREDGNVMLPDGTV
jgi:hypothetical protein